MSRILENALHILPFSLTWRSRRSKSVHWLFLLYINHGVPCRAEKTKLILVLIRICLQLFLKHFPRADGDALVSTLYIVQALIIVIWAASTN